MDAKVESHTTHQLTINATATELGLLKLMMQNPVSVDESAMESEIRNKIWTAINLALQPKAVGP